MLVDAYVICALSFSHTKFHKSRPDVGQSMFYHTVADIIVYYKRAMNFNKTSKRTCLDALHSHQNVRVCLCAVKISDIKLIGNVSHIGQCNRIGS